MLNFFRASFRAGIELRARTRINFGILVRSMRNELHRMPEIRLSGCPQDGVDHLLRSERVDGDRNMRGAIKRQAALVAG